MVLLSDPVLVTDLQSAYDASGATQPKILLDSVQGELTIRDDSPTLGTIFAVQENGGNDVLLVREDEVDVGLHDAVISGGPEPLVRYRDAANSVTFWPTARTFTSSPGSLMAGGIGITYVHDYANVSFAALNLQFTMRHSQPGFAFNQGLIFNHGIQYRNVSGEANNYGPIQGFIDQPNVAADNASITMGLFRSFLSQPNANTLSGGALAITNFANFQAFGQLNTGATITNRRGLEIGNMGGTGGTLTNQFGIDISALSRGTNNTAIRMAQAVGLAIEHTGVAVSTFAGDLHMNNGVSLVLGSTGANRVELLRSAAGVMRMIGVGGTNNEGLEWDFDPATANTIDVQSSTGAGLGLNIPAFVFGTLAADPTSNWQFNISPGAKTTQIAGDFSRCLFSASANITIDHALTNFFTWLINEPAGSIGSGSVTDAGVMLIQTAPSVGTNRYGLLITSNPSGGTLNYALRVLNGDARFDARVDINNRIALGGGVAPTFGTIGGSGPTTAAQAQWLEVDIGGVAHWIPVWT